jgi:hypothetical protein
MTDTIPRPHQSPDIVCSEVLDELVAYAPASSQAVSLNVSARAIFELCNGTRTVDDICNELSESAGIPPEALRTDVQAAISQMRDLGLLVASNS